ncbi:lysylphosphatidylglycerol synthase domain-containing protein [Hydrogenophaga sp. PAMC20947]|uniref:lysylphosphatidylglycerol synthase domain-containing protein n=1 Tax=Hydrogenophaga sp. PAMC20947 TaxID=2565558 RepID=UPI00109D982C|nr:lysylphosphatidylglycerol synthase domain-containing protein [Hydrogenophaga sp. PAMC20947]QCB44822.1 hypothetical protein E5678_01460 [Hydrogenophaga sp. PAMC20947]
MTRSPQAKRLLKWASLVIIAITAIYFFDAVGKYFESIPAIRWDARAWLAMAATILCMFVNLIFGGLMWMALLKDQGVHLAPTTAFRIVGMAQVAKYLPGNVGHLIGQVTLASAAGVPIGVSITTMLISTLWLVATGLSMGGAGLLLFLDTSHILDVPIPDAPVMAVLGVAVAISPWVAVWMLNRLLPGLSRRLGSGQLVALPRFHTAVAVAGGFILCFFVFGLMLKLQATYLFGVESGDILTFTLMFTSAWIAGYLLPGAPGGLGVREALVVALLGSVVGTGTAIGLSVTMRLATVLGDGLAFVAGLLLQWLTQAPPLSQPSDNQP